MLRACLTLVFLALPLHGSAGEISVTLDADSPTSLQGISVSIVAADAILQRAGPNTFVLPLQTDRIAHDLVVSTNGAPSGHSNFDLEISVPFFRLTEDIELAAPVLRSQLSGLRLDPYRTMRRLAFSARLADLIRINERAGRGFTTALWFIGDTHRPANSQDGELALLFVRSANALAIDHFVQPDPSVYQAIDFIETTLANPGDARRIFPNPQDREDAVAIIATFRQFHYTQLKKLVDASDLAIGGLQPEVLAAGCPRIHDLAERFRRLDDGNNGASLLRAELRNLENAAICRYHDIDWPAGAIPADAPDRIGAARATLLLLTDRLRVFAEQFPGDTGASETIGRLQNRRIELAEKLDFATHQRQAAIAALQAV